MKKICVVTGTRAEYGLLRPVIDKLHKDPEVELLLIVTGAHLSEDFGMTYREIEKDGYPIAKKVYMPLDSDTPRDIVTSMGVELQGMADALSECKPDMMILLGDRYECLVAAEAAMIFRIPIAHIHGGEATEGLIDEAIRHSVTKMSSLHFTSTEKYANRVIQLGEQPNSVFCVGALGVENIKSIPLVDKDRLEETVGLKFGYPTAVVTYHPITLENTSSESKFRNLLEVLETYSNMKLIFTKGNSDTDGRIINVLIDEFVARHQDRAVVHTSLGVQRYLSVLNNADLVIGNSSSGIVEAPSFGIPTVDIGDRQRGRIRADSVIHCESDLASIKAAIKKALSESFKNEIRDVVNPYEGKDTSGSIVNTIKSFLDEGIDLKKKFYDISFQGSAG